MLIAMQCVFAPCLQPNNIPSGQFVSWAEWLFEFAIFSWWSAKLTAKSPLITNYQYQTLLQKTHQVQDTKQMHNVFKSKNNQIWKRRYDWDMGWQDKLDSVGEFRERHSRLCPRLFPVLPAIGWTTSWYFLDPVGPCWVQLWEFRESHSCLVPKDQGSTTKRSFQNEADPRSLGSPNLREEDSDNLLGANRGPFGGPIKGTFGGIAGGPAEGTIRGPFSFGARGGLWGCSLEEEGNFKFLHWNLVITMTKGMRKRHPSSCLPLPRA